MIAHGGAVEHIALVFVAVLLAAVYVVAWDGSPNPRLRQPMAFGAAMVTVLVATAPFAESAAQRSFTGHMVQHLALIAVAAPLIAVSRPLAVIRQGLRRRTGLRLRVSAAERSVGRWWRSSGPAIAALVFVGVLFVTHLTSIYDRALGNRPLHDLEHVAYLASAIVLWSVVSRAHRVDGVKRVATVFAVIAGSAMLGMVLISADAPLIATYEAAMGEQEALRDQRLAASLMWVGGMATSLPLLLLAVWQWAASEERIATEAERLRGPAGVARQDARRIR